MPALPIATICVVVVAVAAVAAKPVAKAQSIHTAVVAQIPFAFQVGSYHLPSGNYSVQAVGDNLLWVKSGSDSVVMVVVKNPGNRPAPGSAVVFHHYGSRYFLREVHIAGEQVSLWTGETNAERRAKLEEDALNPNSAPREESKVEIALLTPPR